MPPVMQEFSGGLIYICLDRVLAPAWMGGVVITEGSPGDSAPWLRGWLGIPYAEIPTVTSLADTYVGLHVKRP
jgi:hypothetical protein